MWAVRNAVTFSHGILQQDNYIFIFSPVHELLESAIKLEVRGILGVWRIVWSSFGGILLCGAKGPDWLIVLLNLKTAFFKAHLLSSLKTRPVWHSESYKVFMEPSYTIVCLFVCLFVCLLL